MTQTLHHDNQTERAAPAHTLVGLPAHLRRRIYLYTGVARLDGHPYTYFLGGHRESGRARTVSEFDSPPTRNFVGLLRCCHTLSVETAALLYSANRFVIFYSSRLDSFKHLRALSPTFIASLTSLKIALNESCPDPTDSSSHPLCSCVGHVLEDWDANHHCANYRGGQHRRPLLDTTLGSDPTALTSAKWEVEAMMSQWHRAVAHISSRIGTGRLELFLICDIDPEHPYALEATRRALAPVALFPRLKDCHVRLCKPPRYRIQQMAQEAVLQACGRASPARLSLANPGGSSALTKLPPELRILILEYTDLVTPWKEVTWSRQHRGYQVVRALCASSSEGLCPTRNRNGCLLSNCDPNFDINRPYTPSYRCCFCRRRHGAFSSSCNCWAPPTNLFLISRALYRDAQFVFFSRNRFIIHVFHASRAWDLPAVQHEHLTLDTASTTTTRKYYPFDRLAASHFLRDIVPPHCLANLRFLELVFPPYVAHGWPGSDHPAILDWAVTVDWLRGQINPPALTLAVVMADFWGGPIIGRRDMTKPLAGEILEGYLRIIDPLRPLVRGNDGGGGLAGFYIQAAHPARWTLDVLRGASLDDGYLARLHRNLNGRLVCHVWGPGCSSRNHRNRGVSMRSWQRWYKMSTHGD